MKRYLLDSTMTRMIIHDQAAGLRNLASFQTNDSARVFTIAGGKARVGKTSIVINLAAALAKNGQRVLLIDENPCHNNICTNLGLQARFDLLHVINRDKRLDQVLLHAPGNITILSAMRGIHALNKLNPLEQDWLILVNNVDSEADSLAIDQNLYKVARHYLSVTLEFIGYIQNDEKLRNATQLCKPVIEAFPASQAAMCFRQLAQNVLHSSCPDKYNGGIDNFMQRLI